MEKPDERAFEVLSKIELPGIAFYDGGSPKMAKYDATFYAKCVQALSEADLLVTPEAQEVGVAEDFMGPNERACVEACVGFVVPSRPWDAEQKVFTAGRAIIAARETATDPAIATLKEALVELSTKLHKAQEALRNAKP